MWIAVLAAWAVARLLQFLWNSNAETWTTWDGDHEIQVNFWQYVQWGQLKADLKSYIYFSWHFLCRVMKECWSIIILVQCWEMYWRLPQGGCEDVERQLVKILFLKGGSLGHQMYFQQCRTAKKVESIEVKQGHMEYRDSERACKDNTRHVAKLVEGYKPEVGDQIYLERGLRSQFEQVMVGVKVQAPDEPLRAEAAPDTGLHGYWRLLCTEVLLRHCRDVLGMRLNAICSSLSDAGASLQRSLALKSEEAKKYAVEDKILQDKFRAAPAESLKEAKKTYEGRWSTKQSSRFLNNLKLRNVNFWSPLQTTADWSECNWTLEECPYAAMYAMKSQILERRTEMEQMFTYALEWAGGAKSEMKIHMMEDMPPLVKAFLQDLESSGALSAGEAVQPVQQRRA